MQRLVVVALAAAVAGCAPAATNPHAVTTRTPATSVAIDLGSNALAPVSWPAGTVTCAELEEDFPTGADDHGIDLDQGVFTFYRGPAQIEETIQSLDDPTCAAGSTAWDFMIRQVIDLDALYRVGTLCDFHQRLNMPGPQPANFETVAAHLAVAAALCS